MSWKIWSSFDWVSDSCQSRREFRSCNCDCRDCRDSAVTVLELLVMEVLLLVLGEKGVVAMLRTEGTSNMEGAAPKVEIESSSAGMPSLVCCSDGR